MTSQFALIMGETRSILFLCISVLMLTLGGSFYSFINYSDSHTELPKTYCVIKDSLSATYNASEQWAHQQQNSHAAAWWMFLCLCLPAIIFVLDFWHYRQSMWTKPLCSWTCLSTFYNQHAYWIWHHLLGQSISFGTTEMFRYFLLEPNQAFWQQCSSLSEDNGTTTTTTTTESVPINMDICGPNASLPLLASALCLNKNVQQSFLTGPEEAVLSFLMQNLHSMPNVFLVSFGTATFIFLYLFYTHPHRLKVPTMILAFIWIIYTFCFLLISLHIYHLGQASFLDIIISFIYGLILQGILFIVMQKYNPSMSLPITTSLPLEPIIKNPPVQRCSTIM